MDAVELLKTDHRTVDRLFERYESMGESASGDRKEIVQAIIRELSIHASVEEEILYPTVREALPEGDPMAEEALGEHQEVKEVLVDLDRMDPAEPTFDSKVRSLIGDVRHHVEEEEAEMLPRLSLAISKAELEELGRSMEAAKISVPTRPHPHAPAAPPGNLLAGPVAAVVDRVRDVVSGRSTREPPPARPARKTRSKRQSSRKPPAAKKASAGAAIHVTADPNGGWRAGVRGARALAKGDRKQDVVRRAREAARRRSRRLVIHKADGQVQEERTY